MRSTPRLHKLWHNSPRAKTNSIKPNPIYFSLFSFKASRTDRNEFEPYIKSAPQAPTFVLKDVNHHPAFMGSAFSRRAPALQRGFKTALPSPA
jgi:hypothetical protein